MAFLAEDANDREGMNGTVQCKRDEVCVMRSVCDVEYSADRAKRQRTKITIARRTQDLFPTPSANDDAFSRREGDIFPCLRSFVSIYYPLQSQAMASAIALRIGKLFHHLEQPSSHGSLHPFCGTLHPGSGLLRREREHHTHYSIQ